MSCAAIYLENGNIHIATDTQISFDSGRKTFLKDGKWLMLQKNICCIFCGDYNIIPIIKNIPYSSPNLDFGGVYQWYLQLKSHLPKDDKNIAFDCIIAGNGVYFALDNFGTIIEPDLDYYAIGTGENYAIGSISSSIKNTLSKPIPPKEIVTRAVEAAKQNDIYCGGQTKYLIL